MNKTVKENIHQHLDAFELSAKQLSDFDDLENRVLQNVETLSPDAGTNQSKSYKGFAWPLLASVLLAGVLMATLLPLSNYGGTKGKTQQELIYAIAAEVSYNHLKLKPLEVANTQLSNVTQYFKKLDFNPLGSSQVLGLSSALIGGRYCSIQGNIAAQLRMQDDKGAISTLFESRFNAEDFGFLPKLEAQQAPVSVHVDGQQVKLWVEKGLVMALVSPISG